MLTNYKPITLPFPLQAGDFPLLRRVKFGSCSHPASKVNGNLLSCDTSIEKLSWPITSSVDVNYQWGNTSIPIRTLSTRRVVEGGIFTSLAILLCDAKHCRLVIPSLHYIKWTDGINIYVFVCANTSNDNAFFVTIRNVKKRGLLLTNPFKESTVTFNIYVNISQLGRKICRNERRLKSFTNKRWKCKVCTNVTVPLGTARSTNPRNFTPFTEETQRPKLYT